MVECQCGPASVHRLGAAAREIAVEVTGDLDGGFVADRPEGTDDVPVAGQVEGTRDVHRLIGQCRARPRRLTG